MFFGIHKNNPVKINSSSTRSGGEIFWHENSLYRPAQNCYASYGQSLTINKIEELSAENFKKKIYTKITPDPLGSYRRGLHNISKLGENLTLIDGKKIHFTLNKPLTALLRPLYRLFIKKRNSPC